MSDTPLLKKRPFPHNDSDDHSTATDVAPTRKRRAFLQTMGQQLREFGTESTSPSNQCRTSFNTSPTNILPASQNINIVPDQPLASDIDTTESDGAPGEDDQLAVGVAKSASWWIWKTNEVLPCTAPASPIVFEDLLARSKSYFDYWHPAFSFLHAPSILDNLREIARKGAVHDASSSAADHFQQVALRSIMSISTADRLQMSTQIKAVPDCLVFHSYNDAINSVHLVLTEESSILSLQALVSVQLFLITMHRYNAASRLEGLAVRMVFQLGLHRCPSRLQSRASKECELRKRLFWSVFCIDRYICIRLGTPLGLRLDELDVCYVHTERHSNPTQGHTEHDDRLDLLEYLARHAKIRGSIMQNRCGLAEDAIPNAMEQVLDIEADHTKWWNMVDEHLSDDDRSNNLNAAWISCSAPSCNGKRPLLTVACSRMPRATKPCLRATVPSMCEPQ